jgi:hypothetical protein
MFLQDQFRSQLFYLIWSITMNLLNTTAATTANNVRIRFEDNGTRIEMRGEFAAIREVIANNPGVCIDMDMYQEGLDEVVGGIFNRDAQRIILKLISMGVELERDGYNTFRETGLMNNGFVRIRVSEVNLQLLAGESMARQTAVADAIGASVTGSMRGYVVSMR